jgi:hypothetical protein
MFQPQLAWGLWSAPARSQKRGDVMQIKTVLAVSASPAFLFFVLAAYSEELAVMALTPSEMKWSPQGALALPGMEQTNLVGDPAKPGPYTIRLTFRRATRSLHTRIRIRAK